ncbi:ATPase, T2SS/T4P/T4SS family [Leucobacter sp. USCH14]|uniref:CpaF family protein n=1 Tax=Leucobacter sp. USCH14 TaxID=3024838 RepID=UPI0030AC5894
MPSAAIPDHPPSVGPAHPVATRSAALNRAARRSFGGLLPLLDDPELRDLVVQVRDGAARLWLDRSGALHEVLDWEADPEAVHRLATGLIAAGGRHLDELHPCADVRLGDGIRVHAVLPPIAVGGAAVSIRLPRISPPRFQELVAGGLCTTSTAEFLRRLIGDRRNVLITGGTGSGKTTVLAALLDLSPSHERILTIEDVAELRLRHRHAVSLETRQASAEGIGEISIDRLLREALRMRPDRIVLGECRGAEISTLLAALNTGHDGGAGTLHASRLEEVPARLESLGALAGWGPEALARQAVTALHAIVHVERAARGPRVRAIGALELTSERLLGVRRVVA